MHAPASSAAPGIGQAIAFTVLSQLAGAAFLYFVLKAEGGWQIVGLLALLGAGFYLLERMPWITDYAMASMARVPLVTLVTAAVVVLGFPFVVGSNTYVLHLLIVAQLYAVLALALNFQLGSANIPNFATGASYGIGAYVSALLAINFGLSFWLTLPLAALAATLFGFVIGIPSMRTRDTYLALVTIAFGVVVQQLLNNFDWTGGPNGLVGIPAPSLFGHSFADPLVVFGWKLPSQANFYYLSAALVVVAIITAHRLHGSRIGLAWNALRADEIAAKAQGINVAWYK
ncbi:MAG: branched-chain amino acid ABC transporter permease, partial [Mesorhizobium sp.]|nr:branched-chain amino acid ABC transporter permease [Mesorhizobium sp.]